MSQINESAIKTPGVYVTEIPSFPPSVAQVATAIPVFIGYTQIAIDANGNPVTNQAVRISSLVQYVKYFGKGYENLQAVITLNKSDNSIRSVSVESLFNAVPAPGGTYSDSPSYQMFNSIQMFFANGGADCYIISVGGYFYQGFTPAVGTPAAAPPALTDFISAGNIQCFEVLRKEDEPTLIVIPDAVMLTINDFNTVMTTALQQCGDLQDRFTIVDVFNGDQDRTFNSTDVISIFRNGIGASNLNYGAAYYPWLSTSLPIKFSFANIQVLQFDSSVTPPVTYEPLGTIFPSNALLTQIGKAITDQSAIKTFMNDTTKFNSSLPTINASAPNALAQFNSAVALAAKNITEFIDLNSLPFTDNSPAVQNGLCVQSIFDGYTVKLPTSALENLMGQLISIAAHYTGTPGPATPVIPFPAGYTPPDFPNIYGSLPSGSPDSVTIAFILPTLTNVFNGVVTMVNDFYQNVANLINGLELQIIATVPTYANIKNAIADQGIVVPPSGAIAGIYAAVDSTRGVWKAPANVSLNSVIAPLVKINDDMQEDLNVDVNSGKSVNAIRAFTGKGNLVWGARTLTGNDNDFRYISVRRFYIMVEESVKLATYQFVFEPNDGNTWVRVRAMIENYLTNLWRLGALPGSKPELAFYVKVGLGQTMTFDDILNGKMIIEIGMAPVRPAEFIILRFSQIQQQA